MRAVINQMLKPAQIAKAPGLVGPVLASLHRDQGFLPGDLVYLVGQMRGLSTGAVEFRAVPGTDDMVSGISIVRMDPSAEQIFAAIREGKPITGVGTQLAVTPPSEANTTVAVIDAGGADAASQVEDTLTNAGFNISPGIVSGDAPKGVDGTGDPVSPRRCGLRRRRQQVLPGPAGPRGERPGGVRRDPRAGRVPPDRARTRR